MQPSNQIARKLSEKPPEESGAFMQEVGRSHLANIVVIPETGLGSYTDPTGTDHRLVTTFVSQRCRNMSELSSEPGRA